MDMLKKLSGHYKWVVSVTIVVLAVCSIGGLLWTQQANGQQNQVAAREETVTRGDLMVSLTEEGTASVTTDTTAMNLDVTLDDDTRLDLSVEVEEVLIRAGENVVEGQPLFVLNQASLEKALDTLDDAYRQAALEADQAELDLALGQAQSSGTLNENLTAAEAAEQTYANTLSEMQLKLISYQKVVEETAADLEEKTKLSELYNLRTATLNNMKSMVTYYEEALEALEDFYDDYNSNNADYKSSYNNYKNKLASLTTSLEKAEATYESYVGTSEESNYYQSYMSAADSFNEAIDIINKYQSVVDEYDTLENRIEDAQDCLEEAQEAYNEFKEDYQEWYGSKTKTEVDREVRQMELDLEEAQLTLDNYQASYNTNVAKAESNKTTTATTGDIAQLTYASTNNKLQQKVISTQLTASNLKAYVDELNSYLQDNIILSPCDGLVTNIAFEAGDEIDLTYDYITIAQHGSVTVSLSIDQEDITSVSLDQRAVVSFDASGDTYDGWVDAISVSPASMGSPTVSYTVSIVVEDERLTDVYEGMSCTVDLVSDSVQDVLSVSKRAITTQDGKSYVKVKQQDGSSVLQEVTLGFTDGVSYEILSGLNEGDTVLIESQVSGSSSSAKSTAVTSGDNAPAGGDMPGMGEGGMPHGTEGNS